MCCPRINSFRQGAGFNYVIHDALHIHSFRSQAHWRRSSPSTSVLGTPTACTSTPAPLGGPATPWRASCAATGRSSRGRTCSPSGSPSRCSGEASPYWRQVGCHKSRFTSCKLFSISAVEENEIDRICSTVSGVCSF